jgi:hypothetical protein
MTTTRRWLDDEAGWHPVERLGAEPVKQQGWALKLMHQADAIEEVELLEWELEKKEEELADARQHGDDAEWFEMQIEIITDAIDGLLKGELRAQVPAYDHRGGQAGRVKHEKNPNAWVREAEQRTMRAKLRARKLAAYDRDKERNA